MDPFDKLPFEGLLSRASTLVERSGSSGLVEWQGRRDSGSVPCPSEALAEEGMRDSACTQSYCCARRSLGKGEADTEL
jgi:hypothetical protein